MDIEEIFYLVEMVRDFVLHFSHNQPQMFGGKNPSFYSQTGLKTNGKNKLTFQTFISFWVIKLLFLCLRPFKSNVFSVFYTNIEDL